MSFHKHAWIAIMCLAAHATAQSTLTTILDFSNTLVALPKTGMVIGPHGVLYGTASWPPGYAVFSLTPPAEAGGSWTYATLYQVTATERSQPVESAPALAIDSNGVIYGATNEIVDTACTSQLCGWIFSLTPPTSPDGSWTETTLYTFTGGADGSGPEAGVTIGPGGVLYGTAFGGSGNGLVFSLAPPVSPGGAWTFSTLHNFSGETDGAAPSGPLAIDNQGVLYGTTYRGGGSNYGSVFSLTPPAAPGGEWTESVIYSFLGGENGVEPQGILIGGGSTGPTVLYGVAGFLSYGIGGGLAYSLTAPAEPGGAWSETVLYAAPGTDQFAPGPLVWGSDGVLYGSTFFGGAQHDGSVYALIPPASPGSAWTFRGIYNFPQGFDAPSGNSPYVGQILAVDPAGLIYGTTYGGGPFNDGTVFTLRP